MKKRIVLILLLFLPFFLHARAYSIITVDSITVGNNYFEMMFNRSGCRLQPALLRNKMAQNFYQLSGDLFALNITFPGEGITPPKNVPQTLTNKNFVIDRVEQVKRSDALQIVIHLSGQGLRLRYTISIPQDKPVFRIALSVKDNADFQPFMEKISPWRVQVNGAQPRLGGFGQPVYATDLFFGVEFPAAHNVYKNNYIDCWHIVAQKIPQNSFYRSHSVVVGLAPSQNVRSAFFTYIRSLRPRKDTPFALYNTWYDIRDFNYTKLITTIHNFKTTLIDKYKLKLDAFVIDDGWDDVHSIWEIDRQKFPQGFSPLVTELKKMHSALGLWISPWNGYDKARTERIEWAKKHGFKLSAGRHLCLGDTAYYKIFKEKVLQYQKEGQLSFYKIDGFLSVCNESDHNHLPGIYSRELLTRRFIEILQALRRQNPDIFIDITVGTWLSPWWLQYADAVWMTGADFGHAEDVPACSERDKAITFRDYTLYKDFVRDHYQFPLSNVMTHGIIKGKLNLLGGKEETLQNWQDNAVMYFARGVMMWELYLSPEILSPQEWDFLAAVMKWAYANTNILRNSRFVGGNPYKRQIYGYVHQSKEEVLLVLRNPFIRPQKITLPLKEIIQSPKSGKYAVETLYPHYYINRTLINQLQPLTCELQGYEVRVLRIKPIKSLPPLPQGIYLFPVFTDKNKAAYQAYFDPAEKMLPKFANQSRLKQLIFNGKEINLSAFDTIVRNALQRAALNKPQKAKFQVTFNAATRQKLAGNLRNQLANADSAARLGILVDFNKPVDSLNISLTQNQKAVSAVIKKGAQGLWYWILIPQKCLSPFINFSIQAAEGQMDHGKISFWNLSRRPLLKLGLLSIKTKNDIFSLKPEIPVTAKYKNITERIFQTEF